VPVPNQAGMIVRNPSGPEPFKATTGVTLLPGVYKGGISISSATGITFSPGVYYLDAKSNGSAGVGLVSSGGTTSFSGTEAMLYCASGKVSVSGGGAVTWTPPSSGDYDGLSIFMARNNTADVVLS